MSGQSLSCTAAWTAAVRAAETARPDALFRDEWAAALAAETGAAWIAQRSPQSVIPIVIRTRFFDDFLQRVTQDSAIRQVALLAAGLDTRAFRLPWPPSTRLYELDQADVLQRKESILSSAGAAPACQRRAVGVDLTLPWADALLASGFDPQQPTLWLLEGFLFYLPAAQIPPILDGVSALSAPGSWLGFDIINGAVLTSQFTRAWVEMQAQNGAPWQGTLDDPVRFLAQRGWQAQMTQAGAPDANYGRWVLPVVPVTLPDFPHNWYVTAQKTG